MGNGRLTPTDLTLAADVAPVAQSGRSNRNFRRREVAEAVAIQATAVSNGRVVVAANSQERVPAATTALRTLSLDGSKVARNGVVALVSVNLSMGICIHRDVVRAGGSVLRGSIVCRLTVSGWTPG